MEAGEGEGWSDTCPSFDGIIVSLIEFMVEVY